MRAGLRSITCVFLTTATAFCQHARMSRDGGSFATGRAVQPTIVRPGARPSNNARRFGRDFLVPYYPFGWDYPQEYLPVSQYPPAEGAPVEEQPPGPAQPEVHAHPANSVIHEYAWPPEPPVPSAEPATFTIALKDGSKRSALVAWIQDGKLHYVDLQEQQQVLTSDVIDRDTTLRLNRERNLRIQLPPG